MMDREQKREQPVTVRLLKAHATHVPWGSRRISQHWPGEVIEVPLRVFEQLGPKNPDGIPRMELYEGAPEEIRAELSSGTFQGPPAGSAEGPPDDDSDDDDDSQEERGSSDVEHSTGTVDEQAPDYAAMNRDDLLELVKTAGIEVVGSGRDGYQSKDDLVAALQGAG